MDVKKKMAKVFLIMIICGIYGFIYEIIFYRFDLGYFVSRGDTFGPWLPIYSFGGLLITLINLKDNNSIKIFFKSMIICGLLEYICGYIFLEYFDLRLWDYNNEILNFGNINGFICLRSVLFFGLSGILLIKIINPFIDKLNNITNNRIYYLFSFTLGALLIIDFIINNLLKLL